MTGATAPAPPKDGAKAAEGNGHGDPAAISQEVEVVGTGQLGWDVGGKPPTDSSLRITGGKFGVPKTQFAKGEKLSLSLSDSQGNVLSKVAVLVEEVAFKDQIDGKTGQVVGCERRHKARIAAA